MQTIDAVGAAPQLSSRHDPLGELTPREREVLALMAEGYTDRGIAACLWLAPRTVQTHVRHILRKLDVPTGDVYNPRVRAVRMFLRA